MQIGSRDASTKKYYQSDYDAAANASWTRLLLHNRLMRSLSIDHILGLCAPPRPWDEPMTLTPHREAFIKLATEYWRLLKLTERTVMNTQNEKSASVAAQLRYSMSRLSTICAEVGLKTNTLRSRALPAKPACDRCQFGPNRALRGPYSRTYCRAYNHRRWTRSRYGGRSF